MYFKFPIFTKFIFFVPNEPPDMIYKFSSDLEKIGTEWDIRIKNGTGVDVISEPIEIDRPKYGGLITLVKIKADIAMDYHEIIKEFWVPVSCIFENTKTNQASN